MKIVLEEDELIIVVKNTYNGAIHEADGIFQTTKREEVNSHGLGVENVKRVVDKYKGVYFIKYDECEFSFSISI